MCLEWIEGVSDRKPVFDLVIKYTYSSTSSSRSSSRSSIYQSILQAQSKCIGQLFAVEDELPVVQAILRFIAILVLVCSQAIECLND